MSACAMLSYNNVTPSAWQCGIAAAAQYGVDITANQGNATVSGFTVTWNYDPAGQTVQVQCTDSPWWAPCSVINTKINDAIEQCLTQHAVVMDRMVAS